MTRQQRYLSDALQRVQSLTGRAKRTQEIYGGLCHTVPILVRTNGLCQTLAFIEDKASGSDERAQAHQAIRAHIAATLGASERDLLDRIREAETRAYLRDTRILLDAWVYYKRFAVSILGVESGAEDA